MNVKIKRITQTSAHLESFTSTSRHCNYEFLTFPIVMLIFVLIPLKTVTINVAVAADVFVSLSLRLKCSHRSRLSRAEDTGKSEFKREDVRELFALLSN